MSLLIAQDIVSLFLLNHEFGDRLMKFATTTDFTQFPRADRVIKASDAQAKGEPAGTVLLAHDERSLRRRALTTTEGERILIDLPAPMTLETGDRLALEDGRIIAIGAADEELFAVTARDTAQLAELAWHIGSQHLAAALSQTRILMLRDPAVQAWLEGLGARIEAVVEPFEPISEVPSRPHHGHGHEHHAHHHSHEAEHGSSGERDRVGRSPGDPHYGHNHA